MTIPAATRGPGEPAAACRDDLRAALRPDTAAGTLLDWELARAGERLVAAVVGAGGIEPWRPRATARLVTAHDLTDLRALSRPDVADLVVALVDRPVRDRCWEAVERGPDDRWQAFWQLLARHARPPYCAEPLFLLGWTAWRRDEARLALVATETAMAADSGHRAATMLLRLLRAGVRSADLPPLCDVAGSPIRQGPA